MALFSPLSRLAPAILKTLSFATPVMINEKTGGMNGSIVHELDRPENKCLKKSVKILEKEKTQIEAQIPVSWADMIAVAGAEAVSLCGGLEISVQLGRIDSMVPDPEGTLPEESFDAPSLKQCFQRKGFSTRELVALSGAHTVGNKGFGNPAVSDNSYFKILLEKPWLVNKFKAAFRSSLPVADNHYRLDLKKAALARLSAVHMSLKVSKSGVKKRGRQA